MRVEQLTFTFYDDLIKAEQEAKEKRLKSYVITAQKNGKPSDNQLIKAAEKRYRETKKAEDLQELQRLIKATAKRMIRHERELRGFYIDYKDEGEEKAYIVADYIIAQYLTRPTFELAYPSAYIYLRVRAALWQVPDIDKHTINLDYEL